MQTKWQFGICMWSDLRFQCWSIEMNSRVNQVTFNNCSLIDLPKISDPRGNLSVVEGNRAVPFEIERVYYLYDIPSGAERGGHAHRELQQLIIAVSGSFEISLDDGWNQKNVVLNRPYRGLYIGPMIWHKLHGFSSGAVCLAFASAYFDEADYFRDYQEYLRKIGVGGGQSHDDSVS